jgi:hypothetical protein
MPTAEEQVFTSGADLTPTLGSPAALIEQAVELALPTSYRGLVIYSDTTPATSGQPSGYPTGWYEWHKRCLWLKPSTGETFQWNGTTWALSIAKPGANTIVGSMVASSTLEIAKLKPDAGSSLKVIRVNLGESAFEYIAPADLFSANSIAVSKLEGTSTGTYFLTRTDSSKSWALFDSATIIGLFDSGEFPVDYISRGSALQVPMTNAGATAITWTSVISGIADYTLPLTKISKTTADAGKWLRVQADGSVQAADLVIPSAVAAVVYTSPQTTIDTVGVITSFLHGLSSAPDIVQVQLVCIVADIGHAVGDIISIESITAANGFSSDDSVAAFTVSFNATNVTVTLNTSWTCYAADGTTGSYQNMTLARWQYKVKAIKY